METERKVKLGDSVIFVQRTTSRLERYPAIVAKKWSETCLNLVAFQDGSNQLGVLGTPLNLPADLAMWATSATYAAPGKHAPDRLNHTWHWPEE